MRSRLFWLLPLISTFALAAVVTVESIEHGIVPRDGHGHAHHGITLSQLNETEVLQSHGPTPPSYWTIDVGSDESEGTRHPGLMALHVLFMSVAFFGALPVGIALRSVKSSYHALSVIVFYTFVVLGLSSSALYKKLTPDMYEGNVHGIQGYVILLLAGMISFLDLFALAARVVSYIRSIRGGDFNFTFASFWSTAVLGKEELSGSKAEYAGLVVEDPEEFEEQELKPVSEEVSPVSRHRPTPIKTVSFDDDTENWAQSAASDRTLFNHSRNQSVHSDETLHELTAQMTEHAPWYRKFGRAAFATLERVLVFAGFMQLLTGIVVYTGGCRGNWTNGCLAHLIKGGIFWCYGLVTFARFLGAFSDLGWAWNRIPVSHRKNVPTAEFVESFVIFFYGITNTWMERFGANPGDPYTTKQVQHISIAVMFWFAGLVGMGLESKTFRRWLAAGSIASQHHATSVHQSAGQNSVAEPPTYIASFNPFAALCIGIMGTVMAAHFQPYLFQVQIHALWGNLLTAFSVMRCLTYFFLWLSPPRSILPSRPPTEAIASFFLACGGLVFMFSTEEVTIAAMRQGHDGEHSFGPQGYDF
jgi:hypothetical protein